MEIIIAGGGAAGSYAAIRAARSGRKTVIFEPNGFIGKKLRITGKGRCNITNACPPEEILSNIPRNPKFLYSAVSKHTPADVMSFFEELGCPLKIERGGRVFPQSDKAEDVARALSGELNRLGVKVIKERITGLILSGDSNTVCTGVRTPEREYPADAVILATGGMSYPKTGSTGEGYALAYPHNIIPPAPCLVPLEIREDYCRELMGLSLKNTALSLYTGDKRIFHETGELLFTHFGISGPLALSASAHIENNGGGYKIFLDLKPALSPEKLDLRIRRDFDENINRNYINSLSALLPKKLIPVAARLSDIPFDKKVNVITKEERLRLTGILKSFPLTVKGFRPISEAIITAGGIDVTEINPKTMESKIISNLYFAGEIIDVNAYTGGYNLQIAFSTAYAAAFAACGRSSGKF